MTYKWFTYSSSSIRVFEIMNTISCFLAYLISLFSCILDIVIKNKLNKTVTPEAKHYRNTLNPKSVSHVFYVALG